jgi:uncharacterized membrane protein
MAVNPARIYRRIKAICLIAPVFMLSQCLYTIDAKALTVVDADRESQIYRICNSSGEDVIVAIGYQDGVSKGWIALSNGRCVKPLSHPVHGAVIYFYAQATRSRWSGNSTRSFCISNRRFEIDSTGGCFNGAESRFFGLINNGVNLSP